MWWLLQCFFGQGSLYWPGWLLVHLHWLLLCCGSNLFWFFFLSLEVVLWLGNILLFLDWTFPNSCFCLLCFGGCFSYLFGFNCFVFAFFQKKKTLWVVLANILGYWVIVWLVLWYLLHMACYCLGSLLLWHFYLAG